MDIYLDMDGVVANWTKAVADSTGADYPQGRVLRPYELDAQLRRDQIEGAMDAPGFWERLEKFSWSDELINLVDITCPTWRFLTKGSLGSNSYGGKAYWLDKHYPKHRERLVVCRGQKTFACKPGDILIDDHMSNIAAWNKVGGQGYHWPEMTNDYDQYPHQMTDLRQFLLTNYKKH